MKHMTLDRDRGIRVDLLAYECAAITYHDTEGGDVGGGQREEMGQPSLYEIMGATIIYQDRDLLMVEFAIHSKIRGGRHAGKGVKTQLWCVG